MRKARGIWKDREDLPDFEVIATRIEQGLARMTAIPEAVSHRYKRRHRLSARQRGRRRVFGRAGRAPVDVRDHLGGVITKGVREGAERAALEELAMSYEVIPVDPEIALKGGLYRRDYARVTTSTSSTPHHRGDRRISGRRPRHAQSEALPAWMGNVVVPYRRKPETRSWTTSTTVRRPALLRGNLLGELAWPPEVSGRRCTSTARRRPCSITSRRLQTEPSRRSTRWSATRSRRTRTCRSSSVMAGARQRVRRGLRGRALPGAQGSPGAIAGPDGLRRGGKDRRGDRRGAEARAS